VLSSTLDKVRKQQCRGEFTTCALRLFGPASMVRAMFDQSAIAAIEVVAARYGFDPAALLAVAEIESGGTVYAVVDGRNEPLIRFEGHYFDRRLSGDAQKKARSAGLASPKAGAVANPTSQAARWKMLARAAEIDANAAYESCSYGVGQVMGAHWKWLGFKSVTELVNLCRSGGAGQVEIMARFIEKAGLAGALRARDWRTFAKGYNGPGFAKNAYDTKMAAAYLRYSKGGAPVRASGDGAVLKLQQRLTAHGFPVDNDGVRGKQTDAALKAFQKAKGLVIDGVAGSATWAALDAPTAAEGVPAAPKPVEPSKPAQSAPVPASAPQGWLTWLWSLIFGKGD